MATQLPDEITGSEASASITRSTVKAPRPQLKGLKMRYFHSGFGEQDPGILGESDSEDEDVEMATAQADTGAGAAVNGATVTKKGKRKHEDGEKGEGSAKKAKKLKTAEDIKKKEEKKEKRRKEKSKAAS